MVSAEANALAFIEGDEKMYNLEEGGKTAEV